MGNVEIGRLLISKFGADPNVFDYNAGSNNRETPLHKTVKRNHLTFVKMLREFQTVNFGLEDGHGYSALRLSVTNNQISFEILKYLAAIPEVDINARNISGTLLNDAVWHNHPVAVRVLIENRAAVDITNKMGVSPLEMAIDNRRSKIALMLINEFKADLHLVLTSCPSLLELARLKNMSDVVKSIEDKLFT